MKKNCDNNKPINNLAGHRVKRLQAIQDYIASGEYPNTPKIAAKLEVPEKLIENDISFLINDMEQPLRFDRPKGGYHFYDKFRRFGSLQHVTANEILALQMTENLALMYERIPYARTGIKALHKIKADLAKSVDYPKGWQSLVSFHTSSECLFEPGVFGSVFDAGIYKHEIEVLYRKPGPGNTYEKRILQIVHIGWIDNECFFFAFDVVSQKMRTYIPVRMKCVQKTGKTFKRKKFSIKERLKHSFHVFDGDIVHDIRIVFSAEAADFVREKKWGGQVGLTELPDGGVELHLRLSSFGEVQRWVARFGGDGLIKEPKELSQMLIKAGRRMADLQEKFDAANAAAQAPAVVETTTTPPIATAKAAPTDEVEKAWASVANLTPSAKQEIIRRLSA